MIDNLLLNLDACKGARDWAKGKSWKEIFNTCHRGDWLLWLFKKTSEDTEENLKLLTRTKAYCALTVKHLMKDKRSIDACEIALKFSDGLATKEELDNIRNAAYNAYADAYATTDAYAASTAYAAVTTSAATATTFAAYAVTKVKNEQETADICRKYLPLEVWNIKED
jgi:hypothetical protein